MTVRKLAQLTGHNAAIFALANGRNERHFFSGAGDGWVAEWDFDAPETGRLVAKVETRIFSLRFLKDRDKLVAGNMDGGLHWIDLKNPGLTKNIAHHKKGVFDILQVGESIFTAGGEGKLTRWSAEEGRSLESLHLSNQSLRCLDFSAQRNEIAAGGTDNSIYLLDAGMMEPKKVFKSAHASSVFTVRYSPDGRYLLSGGRDAHLNVWNLENFEKISSQPAHWYTVNHIAFHPEGRLFATASRDKTIKIWDAETFELLKVLDTVRDGCHLNSVNKLLWSPYRNTLVSCSDDRSIILWET